MPGKHRLPSRDKIAQAGRVQPPDTQPEPGRVYTQQQIADLLEWLTGYQHQHGLSNRKLGPLVGFSWQVIQQVRAGSYSGNVHNVAAAIEALRSRTAADEAAKPAQVCVPTSVVEDIAGVVKLTEHLAREGVPRIGLITGPGGGCKSIAMQAICERQAGVYVLCLEAWRTPTPLLDAVGACLRLAPVRPTDRLITAIVWQLRGTCRLVVFDEAHTLDKVQLNTVSQVFIDLARCPVILAGQPALQSLVLRGQYDAGRGATLYSRIGCKLNIADAVTPRTGLDPEGKRITIRDRRLLHSTEDVKRFLASREIRLHPKALAFAVRLVNVLDGGQFRTLETLVITAAYANPAAAVLSLDMLTESLELLSTIDEVAAVARAELLAATKGTAAGVARTA